VKRYVEEPGSQLVRRAMRDADGWFACRVGYAETLRAVGLAAGRPALAAVRAEWGKFGVIEVDDGHAEAAARLAVDHALGALDALHLAAARLLPPDDLIVATWDRRLHAAVVATGLAALPASLPPGPSRSRGSG